jgi:hypothetical protein
MQGWQIYKCNTAYKQKQGQKTHDLSTDVKKAFDKIQHPFMIKALMVTGIKGMFLNIIKAIYDIPRPTSY